MTPSVLRIVRIVSDRTATYIAQGYLSALSRWVLGLSSVPQFCHMVGVPSARAFEGIERRGDGAEINFIHASDSTRVEL